MWLFALVTGDIKHMTHVLPFLSVSVCVGIRAIIRTRREIQCLKYELKKIKIKSSNKFIFMDLVDLLSLFNSFEMFFDFCDCFVN